MILQRFRHCIVMKGVVERQSRHREQITELPRVTSLRSSRVMLGFFRQSFIEEG